VVRDTVPRSRLSLADGAGPDLRNYRVDFFKLAGTFPDLSMCWSMREGVDESAGAYAGPGLTYDVFMSTPFVRLRRIGELPSADSSRDATPADGSPCRAPRSRKRFTDGRHLGSALLPAAPPAGRLRRGAVAGRVRLGQPEDQSGASVAVGLRLPGDLVHGRPRRAAAPGSTYARC
jgi:hypothetical protein